MTIHGHMTIREYRTGWTVHDDLDRMLLDMRVYGTDWGQAHSKCMAEVWQFRAMGFAVTHVVAAEEMIDD